ncbi:MAG: TolB-like translocation protein [Armatimonadota bacterium]
MTTYWHAEGLDLDDDPASGAAITRLTARPLTNINIYCEQPYTSPDGLRVAYTRAPSPDPRVPPYELCVIDLPRLRTALIEPVVASSLVATSSWSGLIYYLRPNRELICVDLTTLEKQIVITDYDLPLTHLETVSPDHRYLAGAVRLPDNTYAIARVDLKTKEYRLIYQSEEALGHVQFNPVHGRELLVQVNKKQRFDPQTGHWHRDQVEVTHIYVNTETGALRELPVGPPHTANTCGHSAWAADSGRIGVTVNWKGMIARKDELAAARGDLHDPRHPNGNFVTVGPNDTAPHVFTAPEHIFNHVNVSKCGDYFVADSYRNGIPGPIELVVGNIRTGKYRTLVSDCGASGGGPACSHPHPYFTADLRRVIYNSDGTGICHVHAARMTDEFLASLE